MPLLLLNEDELRQVVTISEAIEAVEAAFAALAEGRLHLPGEFALNLPEVNGEIRVKGTYLDKTPYYVVKVRSNFRQNPMRNLSSHSGLTAVVDVATGIP
ncbi:MAG TPA: ornithine cyclodeaminase family protein, partial [Anaerolineae bacterium]